MSFRKVTLTPLKETKNTAKTNAVGVSLDVSQREEVGELEIYDFSEGITTTPGILMRLLVNLTRE